MSSNPPPSNNNDTDPPVETVEIGMDTTVFPTFESDEQEREKEQQANVMRMMEVPLLGDAAREAIRATVHEAFNINYTPPNNHSTPTRKKGFRNTDRSKSIHVLLRDSRFVRSSVYWTMESIQPHQDSVTPFPVSKMNCADMASLYAFTTGANTKQCAYNNAKLGIGHFLQ